MSSKIDFQVEISKQLINIFERFKGRAPDAFLLLHYAALVWLKRITDLNQYRLAATSDDEAMRSIMVETGMIHLFHADFNTLIGKTDEDMVDALLNETFKAMSGHQPDVFKGIVDSLDFESKLVFGDQATRQALFKEMILALNDMDFSPGVLSDRTLGSAMMSLIVRNPIEFNTRSDVFTPDCVNELLVRLLDFSEGKTVLDPSCGLGFSLIKAGLTQKSRKRMRLRGFEIDSQVASMARINLKLSGLDHFEIVTNDIMKSALETDEQNKVDIILSHPTVDVAERDTNAEGIKAADYVYMKRLLSMLKDDGQMALVMNIGVLYRGSFEALARKDLILSNTLEAVIALPSGMYPWTVAHTVILIFNKKHRNQSILLIDATGLDMVRSEQRLNVLKDNAIEKIVQRYHTFSKEDGFSAVATLDEIIANDFVLKPSLYIEEKHQESRISVERMTESISNLERSIEEVSQAIDEIIKKL